MTDMQTSLPLLIVRPSILNLVINFSTHLWPVKWNALSYTFALRILFHLLQCRCNTCTNTINNNMIHFISSHDHIGSSILTSLAFYCCLRPSAPSLAQASPSCGPSLQNLQLALHACNRSIKPSLVLIFSTLITWLNVMSHVQKSSFIITCVSFATFCICGLITCVSHLNTLVHLRLSLNYQNQTRTFQRGSGSATRR